jgi:uncharacterized Zn finger protein (UPF0148 family)
MENWNHVCFACRVAVRQHASASGQVRCPSCGGTCHAIGTELRVPARSRIRAWRDLESACLQSRARFDYSRSIGRKRFLQRRIAELSQFATSEARVAELEELQRELEGYEGV